MSRPLQPPAPQAREADTVHAWLRLGVSMLVTTIGGVGLWSVIVTMPAVQAEFAVAPRRLVLTPGAIDTLRVRRTEMLERDQLIVLGGLTKLRGYYGRKAAAAEG